MTLAAPAPDARLRRLRAQVFAATWLSYAGFYMCRKVVGVVKGPLKHALQVDDVDVAHLTTVYLIAYAAGQFATAWLSRRVTSKTLLLCGMTVSVLSNLAIGALCRLGPAGYSWILVAIAVQGLAQATGWSANVGIMAQWTPHRERGRIMALWGTCYQIGSGIAKWFGGLMFGLLGLAWSFWGSSVVLLGICVLFFFWCRESPGAAGLPPLDDEPALPPPAGTSGTSVGAGAPAASTGRILRTIVAMGLIYFSFKFLRYALDSWAPLILAERFSLSTSDAANFSTAFDWLGFGGVLAAGWVSDRLFGGRRVPVIFFGAAGTLGATLLLWAVGLSSAWAFTALLGLIGLMLMGPDSLLSGAAAMDLAGPKWAVRAAALINGIGAIGPIVQEEAIGWLKVHSTLDGILLLLVGVAALATAGTAAFWLVLRRSGVAL